MVGGRAAVLVVTTLLIGALAADRGAIADPPPVLGSWTATAQGVLYRAGYVSVHDGHVYVTDSAARWHEFSENGAPLGYYPVTGLPWTFSNAGGIAVDDSGNVYVADYIGSFIAKLSSSGSFVSWMGRPGTPGQTSRPQGLAFGPGWELYVTDFFGERVVVFDRNGTFQRAWHTGRSYGVAVDDSGFVYITGANTGDVTKYRSDGTLVLRWGSIGTGPGQFNMPFGVTVAPGGRVLVSDYGNNRVEEFTTGGVYLGEWGSLGSGPGEFSEPAGLFADASGAIYVAELGNRRVSKFGVGVVPTLRTSWGRIKSLYR